jgi:hypothetical protein
LSPRSKPAETTNTIHIADQRQQRSSLGVSTGLYIAARIRRSGDKTTKLFARDVRFWDRDELYARPIRITVM